MEVCPGTYMVIYSIELLTNLFIYLPTFIKLIFNYFLNLDLNLYSMLKVRVRILATF